MFAQLGARGASIMFSSGDDGVGGGECLTNDGTNRVQFQPNFPASCKLSSPCRRLACLNCCLLETSVANDDSYFAGPFVTTVGGTIRTNPEVAVDFSGGGFSNYFAQPSYQSTAVSTFLAGLGDQFQGLFK